MSATPSVRAFYRCLYGAEYMGESLASHGLPSLVHVATRPWGSSVGYVADRTDGVPEPGGAVVPWPDWFDDIAGVAREAGADVHRVDYATPQGIHERALSGRDADVWVLVEPDHVFDNFEASLAEFIASGAQCAYVPCIELWRRLDYAIPFRGNRVGPVFWRGTPIGAGVHGACPGAPALSARAWNVGFAWPEDTVRWKHRIALAMSGEIGDDTPRPDWFRVWRDWQPGDRDLEPAAGHAHLIPFAEPINVATLPALLRARHCASDSSA